MLMLKLNIQLIHLQLGLLSCRTIIIGGVLFYTYQEAYLTLDKKQPLEPVRD